MILATIITITIITAAGAYIRRVDDSRPILLK